MAGVGNNGVRLAVVTGASNDGRPGGVAGVGIGGRPAVVAGTCYCTKSFFVGARLQGKL